LVVAVPSPLPSPTVQTKPDVTWQEARELAEQEVREHGRAPLIKNLAKLERINCSPSTMKKAFAKSTYLKEEAGKYHAKRKSNKAAGKIRMNDGILSNVAQTAEEDPAQAASLRESERAMRALIEGGSPQDRARYNSMSPEQQRELLDVMNSRI
jgi:hypothetical protein